VKGLEQLRILRLNDNRLTSIDVDAFQSTPLLTELGLAENQLREVTAGTLRPLDHLHQLSLDGNRLKVHRQINNIVSISIKTSVITFCVSRRRRKMYSGHARLCVCVSACPRPYAHTTARTRM